MPLVTWTAPTGGGEVVGYVLQRRLDNGPFETIASPTGLQHADTTAVPGATYGYRVAAVSVAGTGDFTAEGVYVAPGTFPVQADGRRLLTSGGEPFIYLADTVWLASTRLLRGEFTALAERRAAQGYTALQLSVLSFHDELGTGVLNRYSDAPFVGGTSPDMTQPLTTAGTSSDPSSSAYDYWDHIDFMLDECARVGLLAVLVPCWYGYRGAAWRGRLLDSNAASYGTFLGQRFGARPGVMWLHGGDDDPSTANSGAVNVPSGLDTTSKVNATNLLANALRAASTVPQQATYHTNRSGAATPYFNGQDWYTISGAYTDEAVQAEVLAEWNRSTPLRPVVSVESWYDARETMASTNLYSQAVLRGQAYNALLSGAAGFAYGHEEIWDVNSTWQARLEAGSAADMTRYGDLHRSYAAAGLLPDLRSGNAARMLADADYGTAGSTGYGSSAVAADGSCGVAYLPTARTVTVQLGRFAGPVWLTWWRPTDRATVAAGAALPATGTAVVTTPSGWTDAVLVARTDSGPAVPVVTVVPPVVVPNVAPTANAGADQSKTTGQLVTLTGAGTDIDGTIASYAWTLTARPAGSTATLAGAGASRTFTADLTGTYTASLVVTDDDGATSSPDTVTVTAAAAVSAALIDTFTRTSATSPGTADTGQVWTPRVGTWGTDGSALYTPSAVDNDQLTVPVGSVNTRQAFRPEGLRDTGRFLACIARWETTTRQYWCNLHSTGWIVIQRRSSTNVSLTSSTFGGVLWTDGDLIEFDCTTSSDGLTNTLVAYVNGVEVRRATDTHSSRPVAGQLTGFRFGEAADVGGSWRLTDYQVTVL